MGTPYTPPGKDPTGYPGPTPDSPQPALSTAAQIVRDYNALSFEDKQKGYAELMAHNPNASAAGDSTT